MVDFIFKEYLGIDKEIDEEYNRITSYPGRVVGGKSLQKEADIKDNLEKRLKRIEGQVKGIRRMIDEGKDCQDILTQVSAVRSAMKMVGNLVLNHYAGECLLSTVSKKDKTEKIEEIQKLIQHSWYGQTTLLKK